MTVELKVEGMDCQHCVRAVTGAIQEKDAAAKVEVDLATGLVRAETSLPPAVVAEAIEAEGYKVR
ncbi:heavy-metal-associated domain-containing protein [Acetobacteraceae bacterium H6797]|nr:heavy-metal-associated domain-containing protein [Acetobacteraceae bacterium H6797]